MTSTEANFWPNKCNHVNSVLYNVTIMNNTRVGEGWELEK